MTLNKHIAACIVLDVNPGMRNELQKELKQVGIKVLKTFSNGKAALDFLIKSQERCDLIVAGATLDDIELPQFLTNLRSRKRFSRTLVAATTDPKELGIVQDALPYGIAALAIKPFGAASLIELLRQKCDILDRCKGDAELLHRGTAARIFEARQDFRQAVDHLEAVAAVMTEDGRTAFALGRLHTFLAERDPALKRLAEALRLEPKLKDEIAAFVKRHPLAAAPAPVAGVIPKNAVDVYGLPQRQFGNRYFGQERLHAAIALESNFNERSMLKTVLGQIGVAKVEQASTGAESVKILRGKTIDLLVTGIALDDMSAFELVELVRREFPREKLRILVIVPPAQLGNLTRLFDLGVDAYVMKPFSGASMREALHEGMLLAALSCKSGRAIPGILGAAAYRAAADPASAVACAETGLKAVPSDPMMHLFAGVAFQCAGKRAEAETRYRVAAGIALLAPLVERMRQTVKNLVEVVEPPEPAQDLSADIDLFAEAEAEAEASLRAIDPNHAAAADLIVDEAPQPETAAPIEDDESSQVVALEVETGEAPIALESDLKLELEPGHEPPEAASPPAGSVGEDAGYKVVSEGVVVACEAPADDPDAGSDWNTGAGADASSSLSAAGAGDLVDLSAQELWVVPDAAASSVGELPARELQMAPPLSAPAPRGRREQVFVYPLASTSREFMPALAIGGPVVREWMLPSVLQGTATPDESRRAVGGVPVFPPHAANWAEELAPFVGTLRAIAAQGQLVNSRIMVLPDDKSAPQCYFDYLSQIGRIFSAQDGAAAIRSLDLAKITKKALRGAMRAVERDPDNVAAFVGLGRQLVRSGNLDQVLRSVEIFWSAAGSAARQSATREQQETMHHFSHAVLKLHAALGGVHELFYNGREAFERALLATALIEPGVLALDHHSLKAFKEVYKKLKDGGEPDRLSAFVEGNLRPYLDHAQGRAALATFFLAQSDFTCAERALKASIKAEGENLPQLRNLALICLQSNRLKEAIKYGKRMLSVDKRSEDAFNIIGVTFRKLRKPKKAVVFYQRGLKVCPNSIKLRHNLALALLALGDREGHKSVLREAKALGVPLTAADPQLKTGKAS